MNKIHLRADAEVINFKWVWLIIVLAIVFVGVPIYKFELTPQNVDTVYVLSSEGVVPQGTLNINFYWDAYRTQQVHHIDWGEVEAGTNKTITLYVANFELRTVYIIGALTQNIIPLNFTGYYQVTVEQVTIPPLRVIPCEFVFIVNPDAWNITEFTFDIMIYVQDY